MSYGSIFDPTFFLFLDSTRFRYDSTFWLDSTLKSYYGLGPLEKLTNAMSGNIREITSKRDALSVADGMHIRFIYGDCGGAARYCSRVLGWRLNQCIREIRVYCGAVEISRPRHKCCCAKRTGHRMLAKIGIYPLRERANHITALRTLRRRT